MIDLYYWYNITDLTGYVVAYPGVFPLDPSVNLTVVFKIIPHTEPTMRAAIQSLTDSFQ